MPLPWVSPETFQRILSCRNATETVCVREVPKSLITAVLMYRNLYSRAAVATAMTARRSRINTLRFEDIKIGAAGQGELRLPNGGTERCGLPAALESANHVLRPHSL